MSEWNWLDQAACRGDLQFADLPFAEQAPTCRRCPVRFECLELGVRSKAIKESDTVTHGGQPAAVVVDLARARRRMRPGSTSNSRTAARRARQLVTS